MRIAEVMESRVALADASMPADDAWAQMRRRGLQLYVVTDASGAIGVVTREQLGGRDGAANRCDRALGHFVRRGAVTTTPDTEVGHVAQALRPRIEGCLQVWKDGRLAGVVTLAHLLDVVARLTPRARPPRRAAATRRVSQHGADDLSRSR